MGQEVNPRLVPPLRLGENSVQQGSSDSSPPPIWSDVQEAEEAAAWYDRALPVLLAQSPGGGHRDHLWSLGRDQKPRARVAQACPDVVYPGGLAGPDALTAGQVRPLVDRNCGVDISRLATSDQDHAPNVQPACREPGRRKLRRAASEFFAACKAKDEATYGATTPESGITAAFSGL